MKWLMPLGALFFAAMPTTPTYQINSYGFGSGSAANSTTPTYSLEGIAGEPSGQTATTPTYNLKPGFIETQQAHVPQLSALDNNSGAYYNKLHFVIDEQGNPSDAKYALSISTDNFNTDIKYVKSDHTVVSTLTTADYQTYSVWGGAPGDNIIGLTPNTTYYVKVKATQGTFTESPYGPVSSATTAANPYITFSLTTSAQASPPFSIGFGTLLAGSVINSPDTIDVALDTNASNGAHVYISGQNSGLLSGGGAHIYSATADLTSAAKGFGGRNTSIGQTTGSFSVVSPYNGSSNNVGIIDSTLRSLYTTSGPITGGTASLLLKAKSEVSDPVATDYTEILTLVASGGF